MSHRVLGVNSPCRFPPPCSGASLPSSVSSPDVGYLCAGSVYICLFTFFTILATSSFSDSNISCENAFELREKDIGSTCSLRRQVKLSFAIHSFAYGMLFELMSNL